MEWTVVMVISALTALGIAVIKPVVSLNTTITKLTVLVEHMQANAEKTQKTVEDMAQKYAGEHESLRMHNSEQDLKLESHETRITNIEQKKRKIYGTDDYVD